MPTKQLHWHQTCPEKVPSCILMISVAPDGHVSLQLAAALAVMPAPNMRAVPAARLTKIRRVGINKWGRSDEECGLFIGSRCRAIGEARRQGVYFYPTFCTLSLPPPQGKEKRCKKINSQKCIPPDLITNRFKDIAEAIGPLGKRC